METQIKEDSIGRISITAFNLQELMDKLQKIPHHLIDSIHSYDWK